MNVITLRIPNNTSFSLIKQLDEFSIGKIINSSFDEEGIEIPAWHKKKVLDNIAYSKESDYQD